MVSIRGRSAGASVPRCSSADEARLFPRPPKRMLMLGFHSGTEGARSTVAALTSRGASSNACVSAASILFGAICCSIELRDSSEPKGLYDL